MRAGVLAAAALIAAGIGATVVGVDALAQGQGPRQGQGGHDSHAGHGQGSPDFKLPVDSRMTIEVPAHVREFLRYEMRGHLVQLNTLMARIGEGDFKTASTFAQSGLAVMGNHPPGAPSPGAFMPPEFRMMGQSLHQAAAEVARVTAAAATPPSVADWKAANEAMANLTGVCAGCHGSFRLK